MKNLIEKEYEEYTVIKTSPLKEEIEMLEKQKDTENKKPKKPFFQTSVKEKYKNPAVIEKYELEINQCRSKISKLEKTIEEKEKEILEEDKNKTLSSLTRDLINDLNEIEREKDY